MNVSSIQRALEPVGYQQITVSTSAVGLTLPPSVTSALIIIETDEIRWRDDGTNPTSTVGMPIAAGEAFQVNGEASIRALKMILSGSTDATANVSYYV